MTISINTLLARDLEAAGDAEAAGIKHIVSPVADIADVLVVPNIEADNMIYKNLAFMADSRMAGLVAGGAYQSY